MTLSLQDLLDQLGEETPKKKASPPVTTTSTDLRDFIGLGNRTLSLPKLSGSVTVPNVPSPPIKDNSKRTLVAGLLSALGQAVTARNPKSLGSSLGEFAGRLSENRAALEYAESLDSGGPVPSSAVLLSPETIQAIRNSRSNDLYKAAVMGSMRASADRAETNIPLPASDTKAARPRLDEVVLATGPDGKQYPNGYRYYIDKDTMVKIPIGEVVRPPSITKDKPIVEKTRLVGSGMTATIQGLLAQEFLPKAMEAANNTPNADVKRLMQDMRDPLTQQIRPEAVLSLLSPSDKAKWLEGAAEYARAYQKTGEVLSTAAKRVRGLSPEDQNNPDEQNAIGALGKVGLSTTRDNVAAAILIARFNASGIGEKVDINQESIEKVWQNQNLLKELRKIVQNLK